MAAPLSSLPPSCQHLPPPMRAWLAHLGQQRRYAAHTLAAYGRDLVHLLRLLGDQPLESVTTQTLREALGQLHAEGLAPRSLARALASWRGFYQWWAPQAGLRANPVDGIKAPRRPRGLPKALAVEQAQALLDQGGAGAERDPVPGFGAARDRAMFELLYSSGLRLAELVSLDTQFIQQPDHVSLSWIALDAQEVLITGKGGKTRSVPVGRKALDAVRAWLPLRAAFLAAKPEADPHALFLGVRGGRIAHRVVQQRLTQWSQRAGVPAHVHPHVLRHSFASHLLQSAQDLRAVQELLGHASIASTQIYTRLDFQHLAQAYDQAHPRAQRRTKKP
ncbi:MAG: tyrosine recombinase XerC [Pigmentiphaga sp.]|nr:tyrosine recombinase XerC [Pigmentiphaga sp.]